MNELQLSFLQQAIDETLNGDGTPTERTSDLFQDLGGPALNAKPVKTLDGGYTTIYRYELTGENMAWLFYLMRTEMTDSQSRAIRKRLANKSAWMRAVTKSGYVESLETWNAEIEAALTLNQGENAMRSYKDTVETLLELHAAANLATSQDHRGSWQVHDDSRETGYYGHLAEAIVAIAGPAFYDHWIETSEADFSLAYRDETGPRS